jgi:1-acyl-sn-glycerol-3-phosphate acyltransferase
MPFQPSVIDHFKHFIRRINVWITVGIYSLIAPVGYAILAFLCFCWRRDPIRRARRLQTITANAYRLMHRWLGWTRITVFDHRRALQDLPKGPCVVIANHPTLMDVTAVTAVMGGACSIVKPALYRRAMIKPLLLGLGHVEGPGAEPMRIGRVVEDVIERLRWGLPVVIFPEGTRSPEGAIGRFGRVAFEVACRANVPLVSLTIVCEPTYLSKRVTLLRPPSRTPRMQINVLAVDAAGAAGTDSRKLRQKVEERYRAWLCKVAGTAPASYDPAPKETECQTS